MVAGPLLAIDIGGTNCGVRLERPLRHGGAIAHEDFFAWPTDASPREDLELLSARVGRLRESAGLSGRVPVAVAFPGSLDDTGSVVRWPTRPAWSGLPLTDALSRMLGAVPAVRDDAWLAGWAEAAALRALTDPLLRLPASDSLLYLGLGTGVGGALVTGGEVLPDPGQVLAMEAGHLLVHPGGEPCDCGRRGCLQAYASGPAHRRHSARNPGQAREAALTALAVAVVNLCEIHRVDQVVVGGGFGAAHRWLPDLLARRVGSLARRGTRVPAFRGAHHAHRSSLMGARLLARSTATV